MSEASISSSAGGCDPPFLALELEPDEEDEVQSLLTDARSDEISVVGGYRAPSRPTTTTTGTRGTSALPYQQQYNAMSASNLLLTLLLRRPKLLIVVFLAVVVWIFIGEDESLAETQAITIQVSDKLPIKPAPSPYPDDIVTRRPISDRTRIQIGNYRKKEQGGILLWLSLPQDGASAQLCSILGLCPQDTSTSASSSSSSHVDGLHPTRPHHNYAYQTCPVIAAALLPDKNQPEHCPWTQQETASNIQSIRMVLHMVIWTLVAERPVSSSSSAPTLANTDWEDPNLLSVLMIQHPLELLVHGALTTTSTSSPSSSSSTTPTRPSNENSSNDADWLKWLASEMMMDDSSPNLDNPSSSSSTRLRISSTIALLVGVTATTTTTITTTSPSQTDLEKAKTLLLRLSILLDGQCGSTGLRALAHLLGWRTTTTSDNDALPISLSSTSLSLARATSRLAGQIQRDRPQWYLSWLQSHQLDAELYEWSKQYTLVDCSSIGQRP